MLSERQLKAIEQEMVKTVNKVRNGGLNAVVYNGRGDGRPTTLAIMEDLLNKLKTLEVEPQLREQQ